MSLATGPGPGPGGAAPGAEGGGAAARGGAGRGRWVLALLLLSGLVALTALPVWLSATGTNALGEELAVTVRGTTAAPGVVAAALVLLAAAGALGLVGRVGRWVVGAVVAAAGVLVTTSALAARAAATTTAERAAADVTGVPRVGEPVVVAPWSLLTAALGVLVVVLAVALVRASRSWAAPSDRHERAARDGAAPAGVVPGSTPGAPAGPGGARPPAARDQPVDERGAWDALTRGDDPT